MTLLHLWSPALNNRVFKIVCDDMENLDISLLPHTEVRLLPRRNILLRLLELRAEVLAISINHQFDLQSRMTDTQWLARLAYLTDIFAKINDVNLTLQEKWTTIFVAYDKIRAIKRKLLANSAHRCNLDSFPDLKDILEVMDGSNGFREVLYDEILLPPKKHRRNCSTISWIKKPFSYTECLVSS